MNSGTRVSAFQKKSKKHEQALLFLFEAGHPHDAHRMAVATEIALQSIKSCPGIEPIGLLVLGALVLQRPGHHHEVKRSNFDQFPMIPVPRRLPPRNNYKPRSRPETQSLIAKAEGLMLRHGIQLNNLTRVSPTRFGFAFPLESFMTWPFRKLIAAAFPAL
jgi:hypothetical protein